MIRRLAILCFALGMHFVARADLGIDEFRSLLESDRPRAVQLIESIGTAYTWANAVLLQERRQELYCAPRDKAIEALELIQVLEADFKKYEVDYVKANSSLIEVVLLQGLQRAYPCPPKKIKAKGKP